MTGYNIRQIEFLELVELLPREPANLPLWENLERMGEAEFIEIRTFEGVLCRADGRLLECVLALNPIVFAGQRGFILLARDLQNQSTFFDSKTPLWAAQSVPIGIFRARASRRALLLEMNSVAREFFPSSQPALSDLFADTQEFEYHFAQNTLAFKPPFRLAGSIYLGGGLPTMLGKSISKMP